ncbi:unnamed protein product [Periconia digitata]|uniref:Uncharacterized protein n=1 Tax=Periconia digitata TaxID=1303443 RepID=A0A9W4U850_9PLEO|nr:unnamed protein product [Periconia digitata]
MSGGNRRQEFQVLTETQWPLFVVLACCSQAGTDAFQAGKLRNKNVVSARNLCAVCTRRSFIMRSNHFLKTACEQGWKRVDDFGPESCRIL